MAVPPGNGRDAPAKTALSRNDLFTNRSMRRPFLELSHLFNADSANPADSIVDR